MANVKGKNKNKNKDDANIINPHQRMMCLYSLGKALRDESHSYG